MSPRQAQPERAELPHGRLVIRAHEPEPKVLTLMWSLYLLLSAGATIFAADHLWIYDANLYRVSSKIMVAMIGIGVGVLWPMVRLSQVRPLHVPQSIFADAVALCVPAQAVLWPLTLLGGWSWGVAGAIALAVVLWTAAFGGLIALGLTRSAGLWRSAWMLVCLGVVAAAPLWAISTGWRHHELAAIDWRLCSPASSAWGLTTTLTGGRASLSPDKWTGVLLPAALAALLWACYALLAALRRVTPRRA